MEPAETIVQSAFVGTDVVLMARIRIDVDSVAVYLVKAHVDTITWVVYVDNTLVTGAGGSFTPANNVYDTLQASPPNTIWTVDKKGFNFKALLPRSVIAEPFKSYIIPVRFKLVVSGFEFVVRYKIKSKSVSE